MIYRLLLVVFSSLTLWATETEEFYLLPMGQGNGQLIIYKRPRGNIGILYDLGSKSLQMHPKLASRGDWQDPFLLSKQESLFTPKKEEVKISDSRIQFSFQSTPPRGGNLAIHTPQTTEAKLSVAQRNATKSALEAFIGERLKDLNHLFIFLSHPDEDHINYINEDTILSVPITILLAGDWFGDIGATEGATNLTKPAVDVLEFLSQRMSTSGLVTNIHFPYYQRFQPGNQDFNLLIQRHFSAYVPNTFKSSLGYFSSFCLKINPDGPTPSGLQGYFLDLFRGVLPITSETRDVLKNIYIWSLNQPADDVNNHSMVASCTLPNLDLSIILTGDAEHSVFQRIKERNAPGDFRQNLNSTLGTRESHLIMLMLPHHGALANRSGSMLSFFKPNIFGISAGDGGQYGHPSFSLIQQIQEIYQRNPWHMNFFNRYAYGRNFHFIALEEMNEEAKATQENKKGKNKKKHIVVKAQKDQPFFLCPNVYGCIKWDQQGIRTNFESKVNYNAQEYFVLYDSHLLEFNRVALQTKSSGEHINASLAESPEEIEELELLDPPLTANWFYDYLAGNPVTHTLFAGIAVSDKVYFYQLLPFSDKTSAAAGEEA